MRVNFNFIVNWTSRISETGIKIKLLFEKTDLKIVIWKCLSFSSGFRVHSKWVDPPIPEIQQFQYITLKIQGQGHGWGQSSKLQSESNILSTHIPFVPCQWAFPFLRCSIFKISPWKSKVKVIAEGHIVGITPYQLISLSFDVKKKN